MREQLTESERLFEKFCQARGIQYERIPVGTAKTPDYKIYLSGVKIVIEVKEIDPNLEEKQRITEFHSREAITIRSQLGKRIRDKITDTAGKFKDGLQNDRPSILVLQGKVKLYKHTASLDILAGMYGQLCFSVSGNPGEPLRIEELRSGPKKKMTQNTNTSISAIGVLEESHSGDPDLSIYHNCHARMPLNPVLLSTFEIKQYQVNDPQNPTGWEEIKQTP